MIDYDKYKNVNNKFFDNLLSENDDEHAAVGWSSLSHQKRLLKICELGDFDNKSILDVGCGNGAFYEFLKKRNKDFQYTGYDINGQMLQRAKSLHPEVKEKFILKDLLEADITDQFDYSISNGPLNLFLSEEANYSITFQMIDKMFASSRIGFAFSMTSSFSRKKNKDTFYYDPEKIVSHLRTFCNNFKIDHSYLPHDFMVFCYKDDFYSQFTAKE
jgi:SAM-dependent methyltransferase